MTCAPRVRIPDSLAGICSTDKYDRVAHCYGQSTADLARMFARDFSNPPDTVAFPRNEPEVADLLDWCGGNGIAAVPYGGGSSVVRGVEPPREAAYPGAVTIDLRRLEKVSRSAWIQAGVFGPALEAQLKPHGLTLRHFPQSFEFSSLGGWIATRSGGHFATLYTHIDDFVENLRVVTPAGVAESLRTPGSGPSPDRLFIGSEGALGIITEAWMRLQDRPVHRASASVRFGDFYAAAEAVRAISQSGLNPANCRLIDAEEAGITGTNDGTASVLVLGFESADHPLGPWMGRALECCADHGGEEVREEDGNGGGGPRAGAAGRWRDAFFRNPYYRAEFVRRGILQETFETAITWDRFREFHAAVMEQTRRAIREVTGRSGTVTCRFTHVYPDGPAPYFTYHALGNRDGLVRQIEEITSAAKERVHRLGGTITHHHAVGRDHRPWYDRQRPGLFGESLRAAKRVLNPKGILNPGVLIDPEP